MMSDNYGPGIQLPITKQPISADQYGIPMRAAVIDLDQRVQAFGIVAPPINTISNGTPSSAGTEIRDDVLGPYQFEAQDSVRYRVWLLGREMNGSVAGDRFAFNIRNGGASTPTAASPLVAAATHVVQVILTAGREVVMVSGSFIPGAGTVTLAVFTVRLAGTGVCTPTTTSISEFYVEAIGSV
jgi:hypothetical protein